MSKDNGEPFDLEEEISLAAELIERNERAHAAHHLANAVGANPLHPEVRLLAERLIDGASEIEVEQLVSIDENRYYGMFALRAMVLFRRGRLTDAVVQMIAVQAFRPDMPFISALLVSGVSDSLFRNADVEPIADAVGRAVLPFENLNAPELVFLKDGLTTLLHLMTPDHPNSEALAFAESLFARRTGDLERARNAALRPKPHSSYRLKIALAAAFRADGDVENAVIAYKEAIDFDPEDAAVYLDLGDMVLYAGQIARAERYYLKASALDPDNCWAEASIAFCRWIRADDPEALARLEAMSEAENDNHRARYLTYVTRIYETWLPDRPESILKLPLREEGAMQVAVSSLEAPSAVAAALHIKPDLEITIGEIALPDPRIPRRPVQFLLWSYPETRQRTNLTQHDLATPALPPPSPHIRNAVEKIAHEPYDLAQWTVSCRSLGAELEPAAAVDLLAAMVHPSDNPEDLERGDWIFRIQVASALTIAHLDTEWDGSQRQAALLSLLHGPVDWTSAAGVIALAQIAIDEPEHRAPIAKTLFRVFEEGVCPIRFMCLIEPIVHNMLRIPDLKPKMRKALVEYRNAYLVADYF